MDIAALFNAGAALGVLGAGLALSLRRTWTAHPPAAETHRGAAQPDTTIARINAIDALLPQTQCGYCGHAGCRPYAQAIAQGEPINRCPPGGAETIAALADLLDVEPLPLDGEERPRTVAFIREAECIGCTKCIQACPVDAIVGAPKLMHTVLADECTGCDLCLEPCPVDCIDMRPVTEEQPVDPKTDETTQACIRCGWCEPACPIALSPERLHHFALQGDHALLEAYALDTCIECRACESVCPSRIPLVDYFHNAKIERRQANAKYSDAFRYKARFEARNSRLQRDEQEREQRRQRPPQDVKAAAPSKQDEIRAAIARAKAKKAASQPPPTQH